LKKVILSTGTLEAGGLERFVCTVALKAKELSLFDPVVLCLNAKRGIFLSPLLAAGIEVIEAPSNWQRNLFAFLKLRRILRKTGAEVWHSQVNFSLLQQCLLSIFSGLKFMVTERNCYPLKGSALTRRKLQFRFLKLFGTHYSGNSIEVSKHLSKLLNYPLSKIPVIPNGIEVLSYNQERRDELRTQLQLRQDQFVIGYVARFAANKGQLKMLEVFKELVDRYQDKVFLVFIGIGPLKETAEQKAKTLGIDHQIKFLGLVHPVSEYYAVFECTALLSDYEGMPNVVIEAMSYGLPVIANPVGNVTELFSTGGGVVNLSDQPKQIATHFTALIERPELAYKIGQEGRRFISKHFSLANTLSLLTGHYGI
jgi:glycosyltransferase involved in cell wall biosynthesis